MIVNEIPSSDVIKRIKSKGRLHWALARMFIADIEGRGVHLSSSEVGLFMISSLGEDACSVIREAEEEQKQT